MGRLTKEFPVFDCDAHINDPDGDLGLRARVARRSSSAARTGATTSEAWLNGDTPVMGGGNGHFHPAYNPICIAGPQMNKKIMRKLQRDGPAHRGAAAPTSTTTGPSTPTARINEMDLMGIDQVLVIPTMVIMHLPFATQRTRASTSSARPTTTSSSTGAPRCPSRLYGAALLPVQDPVRTAKEIYAGPRPRPSRRAHPPHRRRGQVPERRWPRHDARRRRLRRGVPGLRGDRHGARHAHVPGPGHARTRSGPTTSCSPGDLFTPRRHRLPDVLVHPRDAGVGGPGAPQRVPRPLPQAEDGRLRVERRVAAVHPRHLRPPVQAVRQRARAPTERPAAVGGVQGAVPSSRSSPTRWACSGSGSDFEDIGIWASDAYHHDGADVVERDAQHDEAGVPDDGAGTSCSAPTPGAGTASSRKLFVTDEAASDRAARLVPAGSRARRVGRHRRPSP